MFRLNIFPVDYELKINIVLFKFEIVQTKYTNTCTCNCEFFLYILYRSETQYECAQARGFTSPEFKLKIISKK